MIHQRDPVALERFRRETSALANLHHPGLPRVIDVGEQGGLVFAAFELVEGPTLKELVRTRGVQPLEWTLDLVARLAEAVDYCHQRGVLHRDLKPENVLIEEGSGRPVLVDFGLVKLSGASAADIGTQQRLSLTGEVRGTPNYMAPEQADGRDDLVGPRTDVYGLGGLLYFALSGETPFKAPASYNVIVKVMRDPPPDPREADPSLPSWVAEAVARAMAKDPAQRFESAGELAALLRPQRESAGGERLPWVLVGVALLVFLLGGGFALVATLRARAARRALEAPPSPALAAGATPSLSPDPAPSPGEPLLRATPSPDPSPDPEPVRPSPREPAEPAPFRPAWKRELPQWGQAQVAGSWLVGPQVLPLADLLGATPAPRPAGAGPWTADPARQRLLRARERRLSAWTPGTPGQPERPLATCPAEVRAFSCGPAGIYVTTWDARLRALDPASGLERWSAPLAARADQGPLLLDLSEGPGPDRALIADATGRLTLHDLASGAELAALQLSPGPFGAQLLAPPRAGQAEVLLLAQDGAPQRVRVGAARLEPLSCSRLPFGFPLSPAAVRRDPAGQPELVVLLTATGPMLQPHLIGLSPDLGQVRWKGGHPPVPLRSLTPVDLDGDGRVEVACQVAPVGGVPPGLLLSASDGTLRGVAKGIQLLGAGPDCLLTYDASRRLLVGWGPFPALPPPRNPRGARLAREAGEKLTRALSELRQRELPPPPPGAFLLPSGRVEGEARAARFFPAKFNQRRRRWKARAPQVSGLRLRVGRPGDDRGERFDANSWVEVIFELERPGPWVLTLKHAAVPLHDVRCAEIAISIDGATWRAGHAVTGLRAERFLLGELSAGEHRIRVQVLHQRVPLLYRLARLTLTPGA